MATAPEKIQHKTFQGRIIQKNDTSTNWAKATTFVPLKGEIIIYTDLNQIKIGDGTTSVINLPFKDVEYTDTEVENLYNAV